MFRFFRLVRQKLIGQNKFTKYLLYAIGEILLVVIGILIALQINNWNENNKLRRTEIKILKELEIALKQDSFNLNVNVRSYNYVKRALEIIDEQLQLPVPTNDSLSYAFTRFLFNNSVAPTIGPYETLKSKGLDLITTDSIRSGIIDVYEVAYKYYQDKAKNVYLSELFIQEYCATLFNDLGHLGNDQSMIPHDYKALQNDKLFKTIIRTRISQVYLSRRDLDFNLRVVEKLLADLNIEIERLEGHY